MHLFKKKVPRLKQEKAFADKSPISVVQQMMSCLLVLQAQYLQLIWQSQPRSQGFSLALGTRLWQSPF